MSDSEAKPAASAPAPLPTAIVTKQRRHAWVWLIPVAAVIVAAVLYVMYVQKRGQVIEVNMAEGHGIKAGDTLRCRGIVIGQVEQVVLASDMQGVRATVRLAPTANDIARHGSRFWVERPRVSLTGIGGLDTIAGPRYLAVIPGDGEPQREFDALPAPPIVEQRDASALEVTLLADHRHGLREGAPVLFRGVTVGRILSVGLASDSGYVEARAYIEPAYANLIQRGSRFWNVSGVAFDVGITGIRMDVTSVQALLDGGVMVATPGNGGEAVETGHRFKLHPKVQDEWLTWRPSLAVGGELLPAGRPVPDMVRATLSMTGGRLWTRRYERKAWLLPMAGGPLVPASFVAGLTPDAEISLLGQKLSLKPDMITRVSDDVVQITLPPSDDLAMSHWPGSQVSRENGPTDCILIGDAQQPMLIAASRQRSDARGFRIDRSITIDPDWLGAAAVSQVDGSVIGVLIFDDGEPVIAPVSAPVDD